MFNKFPWSDEHQLNLDWILRILKNLKGGTTNQVLTRLSNQPMDFGWKTMSGGGGGGGTTDYNELGNKPSINNVTLQGNKTLSQLGIQAPPEPADTLPKMDGTAQTGSSAKYAKADHVHPSDTSRPARPEVAAMINSEAFNIYVDINDIQNQIGNLNNLNTIDKSNLVAAINEAAQSGGSVTPEEIQDAVDVYLGEHPTISGTFTNAAKNALLSLLQKVAYIDSNGQTYLNTLQSALFSLEVDYIEADFNQGENAIWTDDSLNDLKQYLTVTAHYTNGTSEEVNTYTLSGSLTAGTSTITVNYDGATDTFTVTVTAPLYSIADFSAQSIGGTATLSKSNGIYYYSGTFTGVIYLKPDGTVSATRPSTGWFSVSADSELRSEVTYLEWDNPSNIAINGCLKFSATDVSGNLALVKYLMPSGGSGADNDAEYYSAAYPAHTFSGLVFQFERTSGSGVLSAQAHMAIKHRLFINGTRYL